jgi:hypothetical protein
MAMSMPGGYRFRLPTQRHSVVKLDVADAVKSGTGCDGIAHERAAPPKVDIGRLALTPVSVECSSAVAGFKVSVDGVDVTRLGQIWRRRPPT